MKTSTKIYLSLSFILLVVIIVAVVTFFMYKSNDEETDNTSWKDVYLGIIKDDNNFEDLSDTKLQLCDLDKDKTPELIVYGTKDSNDKTLAKIYKINDEDKVDTLQFELENDFGMEFLYNKDDEDYKWYIVTEDYVIYDINIEDKNYEIEKSDYDYNSDFEVIEEPDKISFDIEEDKPRDIIKELKKNYIPVKDLIDEEDSKEKSKKFFK